MFLESISGNQPSYGWKSIQAGKELLKQGLRIQIRNGQSINIWKDPWLPTSPPRPVKVMTHTNVNLVCNLWKTDRREWDEEKLNSYLTHKDAELARRIILSKFAEPETYLAICKGSYIHGYWVASHLTQQEEDTVPPNGSLELKSEIWKLEILSKIQHFIWRSITGALSTATRLLSKNIHIHPICQRCCLEDETINHVLFECQHARAVWRCSNLPNRIFETPSSELEENIWRMINLHNSKESPLQYRLLSFWTIWTIWKSRNEFLFNKRNTHPNEDAIRSLEGTMEWFEIVSKTGKSKETHQRIKSTQWEPPCEGWIKLNFDSSYRVNETFTAVRWIARDYKGVHIMSGCSKVKSCSSSLQAEALDFMQVLQIAWSQGWRQVWFESDNQELTNIINQQKENTEIGNILHDIR